METEKATCEKLVFIHLTKTAGGTLKGEITRQNNIDPIFVYEEQDWENYNNDIHHVIYGHPGKWLFGNIGKKIPKVEGDVKYIAFLRHPILRTISHFYHLRNVDNGPVGDKIRQYSDINMFFKNSYHWEFENYFCRIFSNYNPVVGRDDMESRFESAMHVVCDEIFFIGFQEFFDYSLQCLSLKIGFDLCPEKNVNVGGYSFFDLAPETVRIIKELNYFDIKLYSYMLSDFLKKY